MNIKKSSLQCNKHISIWIETQQVIAQNVQHAQFGQKFNNFEMKGMKGMELALIDDEIWRRSNLINAEISLSLVSNWRRRSSRRRKEEEEVKEEGQINQEGVKEREMRGQRNKGRGK